MHIRLQSAAIKINATSTKTSLKFSDKEINLNTYVYDVIVTQSFPRDGGRLWSPRSEELPRAWTRGRRNIRQSERSRVRSWTAQNKIRGVLD